VLTPTPSCLRDVVRSQQHRYSLRNNYSLFAINAVTGVVSVVAPGLDYEAAASYTLTAVASTLSGGEAQATIQVTVTDVNEAPTAVHLFPQFVNEDGLAGDEVGVLTVDDPDVTDTTWTLTLVNSAGGRFVINGNRLLVAPGECPPLPFAGATLCPTVPAPLRVPSCR